MAGACKSCGAIIVWGETKNGKKMPLDPIAVEGGGWNLVDGKIVAREPDERYGQTSHFATCPNADAHRRRR